MELTSDSRPDHPVPRFCPACLRVEARDERLCPHCGESRVPAGYCGICDRYWPRPAGAACPKHEVELEAECDRAADDDAAISRWVTVATYTDPLHAEAPRIRLEAEGIRTFLMGERMGSHSMYQVATGGVKLQVPEPLAADARVLLAQSWTAPAALDDDLDDAWDDLAPDPGAHRRAVMKGVIVFLLLAPALLTLLSLVFGP